MGLAVGIDLGTTNSCVAAVVDGEARVLADPEGHRTQPSVVAFGHGRSVVVGHKARRQLLYAPQNTVSSAKRLIGRRPDSEVVRRLSSQVAYGIVPGPNDDVRVRVQGRIYSLPEVSAYILQHMRRIAEQATGMTVDQAVITVPAYFNDAQRQATRDAARIAGLQCLRILNEPTAAALAYGFQQGHRQHIAVYDLGGGTFDVSILRLDDDLFEVLSTAGDTFLGGDDFDARVGDYLMEVFEHQAGISLEDDRAARLKLRSAAEEAKIALSEVDEVAVEVPRLARGPGREHLGLSTSLDRSTYARLVLPIIQRTFLVFDDALSQARMAPTQIDHVLMVGGMTRFPLIREAVEQYVGRPPYAHINPDEVVARGAAIQAWNLTHAEADQATVLMDVTPMSLGVRTVGGFTKVLIPRNTPIPTEASQVFHTAHDGQTEVRVEVVQGESRMAEDNELLARFVLDGLRPAPRGEVKVRITFRIDADGIVQATASDVETGRTRSLRIEARSSLTEEEIQAVRFDDLDF